MSSIQRAIGGYLLILVCALGVGWFYKANLVNVAVGVTVGALVGAGLLRLVNWLTQKAAPPR